MAIKDPYLRNPLQGDPYEQQPRVRWEGNDTVLPDYGSSGGSSGSSGGGTAFGGLQGTKQEAKALLQEKWQAYQAAVQARKDAWAAFVAARDAGDPNADALKQAWIDAKDAEEAAKQEWQDAKDAYEEAVNDIQTFKEERALLPWLQGELLRIFEAEWVRTGSPELALQAVRNSAAYEQYFPGNRRQNGTLRMTELEYLALMDAYQTALRQAGVNPSVFKPMFGDLVAGNVSANEFRMRIEAIQERIVFQEDAVKQVYADYYGIEMNRGALIASALDPEIGLAILERRISIAEVGGEAALAGFDIERALANRLVQAGQTQASAQELFQTGAYYLPVWLGSAARQVEDPFGLMEYLEAQALGDPMARRQMERMLAGEASDYTEVQVYQQEESGALSGLGQR